MTSKDSTRLTACSKETISHKIIETHELFSKLWRPSIAVRVAFWRQTWPLDWLPEESVTCTIRGDVIYGIIKRIMAECERVESEWFSGFNFQGSCIYTPCCYSDYPQKGLKFFGYEYMAFSTGHSVWQHHVPYSQTRMHVLKWLNIYHKLSCMAIMSWRLITQLHWLQVIIGFKNQVMLMILFFPSSSLSLLHNPPMVRCPQSFTGWLYCVLLFFLWWAEEKFDEEKSLEEDGYYLRVAKCLWYSLSLKHRSGRLSIHCRQLQRCSFWSVWLSMNVLCTAFVLPPLEQQIDALGEGRSKQHWQRILEDCIRNGPQSNIRTAWDRDNAGVCCERVKERQ